MRLRVLLLDSALGWRGGPRQVLLLARGLRERGHEPLVVTPPGSVLGARLRAAGLATAAAAMRADWDVAAARRVRALVRTWRADVVHAHDARAHAVARLALLGRPDVPLVVSRGAVALPHPPSPRRQRAAERVARHVASCEAVRAALLRDGVAPHRVSVVHAGVPLPHVDAPRDWRAEAGWPGDALVCGVVGSMAGRHGLEPLGAIVTRLPAELRARLRLVLLGGVGAGRCVVGGVEGFRAGYVDDGHPALASLDLLWHPSSSQGLGTTVLDAMALGVPAVAVAVGALGEFVEHERSGLLVAADDPDAFAAAVARLAGDAALRARLGAAGPARAGRFGVERMVEATEAVYAAVLDETRSTRRAADPARRLRLGGTRDR